MTKPDKVTHNETYRETVLGFERNEGEKPAICVIIGENGRTKIWVNPVFTQKPHTAANLILGAAHKLHELAKARDAAKSGKLN